jgi:hypothetical protein
MNVRFGSEKLMPTPCVAAITHSAHRGAGRHGKLAGYRENERR